MKLSDFTKQIPSPYVCDSWRAKRTIPTPMGEFAIELRMAPVDKGQPNDEMLRLSDELITSFQANITPIEDRIFEHYQTAAKHARWLEMSDVPAGLDRTGIRNYLIERILVVSCDLYGDEPYSSGVYVAPQWDLEHGIHLTNKNGSWDYSEG